VFSVRNALGLLTFHENEEVNALRKKKKKKKRRMEKELERRMGVEGGE